MNATGNDVVLKERERGRQKQRHTGGREGRKEMGRREGGRCVGGREEGIDENRCESHMHFLVRYRFKKHMV